jgi:hypothetical protein
MDFKYDILGIELTREEYDRLVLEQIDGKVLVVVDGKVIAIERT